MAAASIGGAPGREEEGSAMQGLAGLWSPYETGCRCPLSSNSLSSPHVNLIPFPHPINTHRVLGNNDIFLCHKKLAPASRKGDRAVAGGHRKRNEAALCRRADPLGF